MEDLSYAEINQQALRALRPPVLRYFGVVGLLSLGMLWGLALWVYQIRTGMGVSGLNHPVMWGVYIGDYVFWVAIAMSGTVVSGSLYLLRSKFRNSISRSAEAMAVFAVAICGLFPLIHLGRFWVFYYLAPYPSQRQIWPNFVSPLVWDMWAILTYLATTWIFYFVGLIPDLAVTRDWAGDGAGAGRLRVWLYRLLAGGWNNMSSQWHHYKRSYLYFAALATPLAVSIHTVTSWDFSMSLEPFWHTTIYGPYFVAGAIFSGMSMALTFIIPMRKLLHLEHLIPRARLEPLAKIILLCSLLVSYAYIAEFFMGWYGGDINVRQYIVWHIRGWIKYEFAVLMALNVAVPLLLLSRRVRRNLWALFFITILVNVGMWTERLVIATGPPAHDYLPHNWGYYAPSWVSAGMVGASFCMLFFGILVLNKFFPPVPIADLKEDVHKRLQESESSGEEPTESPDQHQVPPLRPVPRDARGMLAVFSATRPLVRVLQRVRQAQFDRIEVFSPFQVEEADKILHGRPSPVRWWTLGGALFGLVCGLLLTILTALVNNLIVGGKPPLSFYAYLVIVFEITILFGVLFNAGAVSVYTGMFKFPPPRAYDRRFSRDKFGLFVVCTPEERETVTELMESHETEEIHVVA
jgi:Ni/Fe-hydrogenase subunit HybB-like protein